MWSKGSRRRNLITQANHARDAGQWERAANLYRSSLSLDPGNAAIWVQYGHALKESGNVAKAEEIYRRALSYAPKCADTHLQLGHALKLQGRMREAEVSYLRAFVLDPALMGPQQELAGLGWRKETLDKFGTPATTPPAKESGEATGPMSRLALADRAREAGRWGEAARLYRKALDRNPMRIETWIRYGHVLKEGGRLAEAEEAYRTAMDIEFGSADAHFHFGQVLHKLGNMEAAQGAYLRAFVLEPALAMRETEALDWSESEKKELMRLL